MDRVSECPVESTEEPNRDVCILIANLEPSALLRISFSKIASGRVVANFFFQNSI